MPPDKSYLEAQRRIAQAKQTNADMLDLGDLALNDIPPEIGELSNLRALSLSVNKLEKVSGKYSTNWEDGRTLSTFQTLAPLSALRNLELLDLSGCFQGTNLSHLQDLIALTSLDLSWSNQLTDLSPIQDLTTLRSLDLSRCYQLTDLSPIQDLTSLTSLDLSECNQFKDLSPLQNLSALTSLNLSGCTQFTGLSPLQDLRVLTSLDLSRCNQLTNLSPLQDLSALTSLDLSGCNQLTNLSPLQDLSALTSLNLSYCNQLTNLSPLQHLTALTSLNLSYCNQLTNLSPLQHLTALTSLNLSYCNQLTNLSPLQHLTALTSLYLSHCYQLTDLTPLQHLTAITSLALNGCINLTDLSPLQHLTAITSLNLSFCDELTNLSTLQHLTAITSLNLSCCDELTNLSPLATLERLHKLKLVGCKNVKEFTPLRSLLHRLEELFLFDCQFQDLDPALCGTSPFDNVIENIRAHFQDAEFHAVSDPELKLFILGNGGVGKTQTRRRLCGLDFDPSIASTHGIEIERFPLKANNQTISLNIWDFGGQDIYHGAHALFLQRHAVYAVLWTPHSETGTVKTQDLVMRNRPLTYWLDFIRSVANTDAPVLIVQSQFDDPAIPPATPNAAHHDFKLARVVDLSAKQPDGLDRFLPELKRSVHYLLKQRPPLTIGAGRVRVREQLRKWRDEDARKPVGQKTHRTIPWQDFVALCEQGNGDVSSPRALAEFLCQSGLLFYSPHLFQGEIILDQGWALEAIYAIFHRDKSVRYLRQQEGRFTQENLGDWLWNDAKHTPQDQNRFIQMMLQCGICFRIQQLPSDQPGLPTWQYAAPDHLPDFEAFQDLNPNFDPPDSSTAAASLRLTFPFLHDGLLRSLLARIGDIARTNASYWRYGCYFRKPKDHLRFRFDSTTAPEGPNASGTITFTAWGPQSDELITQLLSEVRRLSPAQEPKLDWLIQPTTPTSKSEPPPDPLPPKGPAKQSHDPLAALLGDKNATPFDPIQMIDSMCDLPPGKLGTIAAALDIAPSDLPNATQRDIANAIYRHAKTTHRLPQLQTLIQHFSSSLGS
jgi:internalin A